MYAQVEKSKENKSRAVANSVAQKKNNDQHTLGFIDNRPKGIAQRKQIEITNNNPRAKQAIQLQAMANKGVAQAKGINYEAGAGDLWHVHKDHVKYNGDNSSRINFTGRSKTYIKKQMELYHNTLGHDTNRHHTYLQCRQWINKNL